jgi:hypothetical protein
VPTLHDPLSLAPRLARDLFDVAQLAGLSGLDRNQMRGPCSMIAPS